MNILSDWVGLSGERSSSGVAHMTPVFFQHQKVYSYVKKFVKNKLVLDLGCGVGEGTSRLAQTAKEIIGVDIDERSIKLAREKFGRENLKFKLANINSLKTHVQYDVIVSFQVIEHLKNVQAYLTLIKSSLKRSGIVIITTPNRLTQSYNENPFHVKEYSQPQLAEILKSSFHHVKILGLFGNKHVRAYEAIRKKRINKVLSLDPMHLRRFIPVTVRILFFSLFAFLVRGNIAIPGVSESSFFVSRYSRSCIDLIAVCQK